MRSPNVLELRDDLNETSEPLEFPKADEVLIISFGYGQLVVVSQSHCFIYRENSKSGWASGVVSVELRERCPQFVRQADKYFLLMDGGVLYTFAYDGSLLGTPGKSWLASEGRQRMATLARQHVDAAREVVAIRSPSDPRLVQCLHYRTGKAMFGSGADVGNAKPLLSHGSAIVQLELDPCSPTASDQLMAFLDAGRDLHLLPLPSGFNKMRTPIKIGKKWSDFLEGCLGSVKFHFHPAGGVTSFGWNSDCSMLAFIKEEGELCVIPYPPAVPSDPSLLDRFTIRQNIRYRPV